MIILSTERAEIAVVCHIRGPKDDAVVDQVCLLTADGDEAEVKKLFDIAKCLCGQPYKVVNGEVRFG
jgi:hypothetical protein